MGFFSYLWGTSQSRYPTVEHYLSEIEIKKLVSHLTVQSIDSKDEGVIEPALVARRHGDGKISLRQISDTLKQLQNQNKISKYDREGLMRVFENYFNDKFGSVVH